MSNSSTNVSPLYEADPESIDELFLRLANKQIPFMPKDIYEPLDKKIHHLRQQRIEFLNDLANNTTTPRKTRTETITQSLRNKPLEF